MHSVGIKDVIDCKNTRSGQLQNKLLVSFDLDIMYTGSVDALKRMKLIRNPSVVSEL